jgi:hypothetical protein
MTGEDLPRLQDLVARSTDPEVQRLATAAMKAILTGAVKDEGRKDSAEAREATRFQVGVVITVLLGISLIPLAAAKIITLTQAAGAAGTLAVAHYGGTKLFKPKGSTEREAD